MKNRFMSGIALLLCFLLIANPLLFASEVENGKGENPAEKAVDSKADAEGHIMVALDITSTDLDAEKLKDVNTRVAGILRRDSGASLVTQGDLKEWLEFGEESQKMECADNAQCIADIASAVKNDLLFGGNIGRVGEVWMVNLYLLDAKKAETIGRVSHEALSLDELEDVAAKAAEELISQMGTVSQGIAINLEELGESPRIAVMDFVGNGVEKSLAQNISDVVTVELRQFKGVEVISRQEISAMLSFESVKQGVGCDDESCFAEIGNALGVGYLVVGNVGLVEKTYIIGIKVIDIQEAKIVGREQENFVGPADGLLPAARFAIRRVFGTDYAGEGFLKVIVNEKKSSISLNGNEVGKYPDLKIPESMICGKYRLSAEKDGFHPLFRDVYVEPARQTQVQLMMLEEPPEWWETWWFWTVVGVVVAGGVTTGVVLGTMSGDSPDTGSGQINVPGSK